jgi:hypothetical protein
MTPFHSTYLKSTSACLLKRPKLLLKFSRRVIARRRKHFFLHFNKCGGTSVVVSMLAAGHSIPRYRSLAVGKHIEKSGNLLLPTDDLQLIRQTAFDRLSAYGDPLGAYGSHDDANVAYGSSLWTRHLIFSDHLSAKNVSLISEALTSGASLVCFEMSMPPPGFLKQHFPDIEIFTALRDPVQRIIATYKVNVLHGHPPAQGCSSLANYIEKGASYGVDNLYTRQLCHSGPIGECKEIPLDKQSVELAYHRIADELDAWFLLEQPGYASDIGAYLRLPGGCMNLKENAYGDMLAHMVAYDGYSREELEARVSTIRITRRCLAYARSKNRYDIHLYQRLWSDRTGKPAACGSLREEATA